MAAVALKRGERSFFFFLHVFVFVFVLAMWVSLVGALLLARVVKLNIKIHSHPVKMTHNMTRLLLNTLNHLLSFQTNFRGIFGQICSGNIC